MGCGDRPDQRGARSVDGVGIGRRHRHRQLAFAWRHQKQRREGVIFVRAGDGLANGVHIGRVGAAAGFRHVLQHFGCERLAGFPTVEGIVVARHERGAGFAVERRLEVHGCGEPAAQRQQRRFGDIGEDECFFGFCEFQHAFIRTHGVLAF